MPIVVQRNISLGQHTTLQVGGVADYVIAIDSEAALHEACEFATDHTAIPPLVLGGGSNVLIGDRGYRGVVFLMRLKGISEVVDASGLKLTVMAGEDWDEVVEFTTKRGWSGLENLSGIPGTVGAAPIQNINAYGASVADVISSVEVYDVQLRKKSTLTKDECQFSYRDSMFKQKEMKQKIIMSVTFSLQNIISKNISYKSSSQSVEKILTEKNILQPTPQDIREAVLTARGNIGMLKGMYNSAGSFFKNTVVTTEQFLFIKEKVETDFPELNRRFSPWYWQLNDQSVKLSTAFLLECSPYNKTTFGSDRFRSVVGLSSKHSLSIVTESGATATDVHDFANMIITSIESMFEITIEPEVIFV
jgi:UDP-N-acetylmuramate dehydrogenase